MKVYLDENLTPRIAELLRRRGIDAVSAYEVGNNQLSDAAQLAYAAQHGRCLVTMNIRHFVPLAQNAIQRQAPHAGILLCPSILRGSEISAIAAAIARVARRFPRGLGEYDVLYLEASRTP